jgi:hypothetical protein
MDKLEYGIGSRISYRTFGGAIRTVEVTGRYADVKNGRPGFDGNLYLGHGAIRQEFQAVWGYDSQIVEVLK